LHIDPKGYDACMVDGYTIILLYYYTITHYVNCQWGGGWVEFSQVNNFLMQVIYDYYKLSRR